MFTLVLVVDGEAIFDETEHYCYDSVRDIGFNDVVLLQSLGFVASYEVRCNIAF